MPNKKAALRQKWNNAGQDVVVLHAFPRGRTMPSPSPFPLKFETYLRMADINYVVDFEQWMSPKGKSPWMTFNGKDMADSQLCMEHLEKTLSGKDMSAHLTDKERAVARGIRAIMEDHLYFVEIVMKWKYGDLKFVKEKVFPPMGPKFLQGCILRQIKKTVDKQCLGQGIGRHTKEEVVQMGLDDLKSISDLLGKKTFMMGEKPSTVDCTVFAFLASTLFTFPDDSPIVKALREDGPLANLKKYTLMMKEKYYPDWDELLYKEESKAEKKKGDKKDKKK